MTSRSESITVWTAARNLHLACRRYASALESSTTSTAARNFLLSTLRSSSNWMKLMHLTEALSLRLPALMGVIGAVAITFWEGNWEVLSLRRENIPMVNDVNLILVFFYELLYFLVTILCFF